MTRHTLLVTLFSTAALALGLTGCGRDSADVLKRPDIPAQPSGDYVVATVNGAPLTWAEMDKRAMGYLKHETEVKHLIIPESRMEDAKTHFRKQAVQAFAYKTLMLEEAARQGVKISDEDRTNGMKRLATELKSIGWTADDFFKKGPMDEPTMHREVEDGLLIDRLIALNVNSRIDVSTNDIATLAAQIAATNELRYAKMEAVRKQLLDGADFAAMANAMSEGAQARAGGDLGEFTRQSGDPAIVSASFSQAVGEVGPIIRSNKGYHIVKVTSRMPAKEATDSTPAIPETVRASEIFMRSIPAGHKQITDFIRQDKQKKLAAEFHQALRQKAVIECPLYPDVFE